MMTVRRLVALLIAACAAFLPGVPAKADTPSGDASARMEAYLQRHRKQHRIPGLAYAVVAHDRVVRQAAWGVDGDGAAITAQTPFLLGSVSKPFTATAVMRLAEAGRVGLDDPVRRHVPWFRLADDDAAGRITVRHLLEHTSGLPRWASRTDRFDNSRDGLARSVRDLATVRPETAPGAVHQYSDANYMVLGSLVETVSGQPFGTFLRREVLDPLGMAGSAATAAEAGSAGLTAGHRYWFGHPRRFDAPYDTSGVPYGYLAAGLDDVGHFVMAHLGGGRYSGTRLLSPETVALMHTGEAETGGGGRYGLGWRDSRMDEIGTRVVWHAGAAPGYFAHIVLAPESDLGVIVLANGYSPAMDSALAEAAFTVTRIAHGGDSRTAGQDPLLTGTLYGLLALAGVLLGAVAWSVTRVVRPRGRVRAHRVLMTVFGCVVLAAAAAALPAAMGFDLGQALLWTPDLGRTIIAVIILACALAFTRIAAIRQGRWKTTSGFPAAGPSSKGWGIPRRWRSKNAVT